MLRLASKAKNSTLNFAKTRPFTFNVLVSGTFAAAGDALSQKVESIQHNSNFIKNYSLRRTVEFGAVGFILGPLSHFWYTFLDKKFPLFTPAHIAKKVVLVPRFFRNDHLLNLINEYIF